MAHVLVVVLTAYHALDFQQIALHAQLEAVKSILWKVTVSAKKDSMKIVLMFASPVNLNVKHAAAVQPVQYAKEIELELLVLVHQAISMMEPPNFAKDAIQDVQHVLEMLTPV